MSQQRPPWILGLAGITAFLISHVASGPQALQVPTSEAWADSLPAKNPSQAVPPAKNAWATYVRLYDDFLGTQPAIGRSSQQLQGTWAEQRVDLRLSSADLEESAKGFARIATAAKGHYLLEFLVALVPDPIDSRLPSNFDFTVTGLLMGLNQAGYLFDRKWHPWTGWAASAVDAATRPAHQIAGIMLLHKQEGPNTHLMAVFLVGESPKGGIHRQAFHAAVTFITGLQEAVGAISGDPTSPANLNCSQPIRVLGPSFSGSAASLRDEMQTLLALPDSAPCGFQVVSGSATEPKLQEEMNHDPKVAFGLTVVPDDQLTAAALCFFERRLGWQLSQTALLVEGDTEYGKAFKGPTDKAFKGPTENVSCPPLQRIKCVRKLPFPSGVSAIRNAWEESEDGRRPDAARGAVREPAIGVTRGALEISLADRGSPADSVLELSPLTSRIEEMAMTSLLRTIPRKDIRYVGIVATDVKDEIFLAQQVRRWAPDVTLFLLESNLAYVHPHFHPALFGSLVVSSFPMLTNEVVSDQGQLPQFGSETQKGTFLAVLRLLGQPTESPAVWIAATGNDTLSPLARLRPDDPECSGSARVGKPDAGSLRGRFDERKVKASHEAGAPEARSQSESDLKVILFPESNDLQLLYLIVSLCILAYWLGNHAYLERSADSVFASRERHPLEPRVLLILGEVVLYTLGAGVVALAFMPVLHHDSFAAEAPQGPLHWVLLALIGVAFLCLPLLPLARKLVRKTEAPEGRRSTRRIHRPSILAFAAALLLACLVLLGVWLIFDPLNDPGFFYLRMRRFANGLSPFVSLGWLGAALFAWISIELRRQQLNQRHHLDWPIPDGAEPALSGCATESKAIASLLARTLPWSPSPWFWLVIAVAIVPTAALLLKATQPLADPRAYGRIFVGLALVAFVLCVVSFYRFGSAWVRLRHLLRRLEHCRCRRSFASLAELAQWNPMTSFVWYAPSFRSLKQSVERLEELERKAQVVGERAPDLSRQLAAAFEAETEGRFSAEVAARKGISDIVEQVAGKLAASDLALELQDLYALRLVSYLRHVFIQLRYALMGAMGPALLLIVALNTYTFVPSRFMLVLFWTALLTASALSLIVFVQMDRDLVLSEISNRPPGRVTLDRAFLSNIFAYAVLPLLALASSQIPEVGRVLGHWLDPLQRLLEVG
jgi:hypothetical protein